MTGGLSLDVKVNIIRLENEPGWSLEVEAVTSYDGEYDEASVHKPGGEQSVSTMTSPADQASQIARPRCELDRARMEHDILACSAKTGGASGVVAVPWSNGP